MSLKSQFQKAWSTHRALRVGTVCIAASATVYAGQLCGRINRQSPAPKSAMERASLSAPQTKLRLLDEGLGAAGRTVFVNRSDGSLRSTHKTDKDGYAYFFAEEGDSATVAYGTDRFELLTYLDIHPGESLTAGDPEDEDDESPAVARFPVKSPANLPRGATHIRLSIGAGELDLASERELAVTDNRTRDAEFLMVARAIRQNEEELGRVVVRRSIHDKSPISLSEFRPANMPWTLRLSKPMQNAQMALSMDWHDAHFPQGESVCKDQQCQVLISDKMVGMPRVKLSANNGGSRVEWEARLADNTRSVTLNIEDIPHAPTQPTWTNEKQLHWSGGENGAFTVVHVAWPETRAHVWRMVSPAARHSIPEIALPAELAEWRVDHKGSVSVGAATIRATHVRTIEELRAKGLSALEDLPTAQAISRAVAGEWVD